MAIKGYVYLVGVASGEIKRSEAAVLNYFLWLHTGFIDKQPTSSCVLYFLIKMTDGVVSF